MRTTRTLRAATAFTATLALSLGAAGTALAAAPRVELTPFSVPGTEATPPLPPATTYPVQLLLDDDVAEGSIGVTVGNAAYQYLAFNRFTRPPGVDLFWLDQIWVLFPQSPAISPGAPAELAVYLDPDGDPANGANLLATVNVTVQAADGNTFSVYSIPPVSVSGAGDVLIGVIDRFVTTGSTPPTGTASLDTTASQGRSWIAVWTTDPPVAPTLPPDALLTRVDDFGFPGNFMIRGFGTLPSVVEVPTLGVFGLAALGALLTVACFVLLRRRRTLPAALLALFASIGTAPSASAQTLLDDFATTASAVSIPGTPAATAVGGGVLGGERDMLVSQVSGSGTVSAAVSGTGLAFSAPVGTRGRLLIAWDGIDGNANTVAPGGLGAVDLTAGGYGSLRLAVSSARAGTEIEIRVYSNGGADVSRISRALPEILSPRDVTFDFSDFTIDSGAGASFAAVGAVTLRITGSDTPIEGVIVSTFAATRFETALPAVGALKVDLSPAGTPLSNAAPGDTVRYRVTITNTGATARTVNLSDVLDANLTEVGGSLRTTPVARPDAYKTLPNTPLDTNASAKPSLLANDSDADGNALAAVAAASQPTVQGGSVTVAGDGHFVYTPPAGFTGPDAFTYSLQATAGDPTSDASGNAIGAISSTATVLVERTPPAIAPGGPVTFTEDGPAVVVAASAIVSAPDSPTLSSATVTITNLLDVGLETLAANTTGTSIVAAYFAPTLTLSGSDTLANYQQVLRTVTYTNSSQNPATTTRSLDWTATDPFGPGSTSSSAVNVVAANDPPVLAAGGTLAYSENDPATAIDTTITVTDADHANLASATAQITGNYQNGQDLLSFTNTASITGVFAAGSGTLTLTGTDTLANYETALRSVRYANSSESPSTLVRTVTWIASDGSAPSAPVTSAINVTAVNDAPVLTAGGTLAYTENDPPTAIDTSITVTDADHANLASATAQITGNYQNGQDLLSFTNTASITGLFNVATGTLTLTGSDTVANYQAALRAVRYSNSSENPSALPRTVTWIASDGSAPSAPVTSTINVTAVNDAPALTAGATLAYTENDPATAIDTTITVADPDHAVLASATAQITGNYQNGQDLLSFTNTASITGVFAAGSGTLTLTGTDTLANYETALRSVRYSNSSENPSALARTVTWIANDGTSPSSPVTSTVNVTPVNDAPTIVAGATLSYTENDPPTAVDTTLTVTDPDHANLASATAQITGNYQNGQDLLSFTNTVNISGLFNAATGTMTLTGSDTVANYQAALRAVRYSNSSENPSALSRTVTWVASDGSLPSSPVTSTVNVIPVNDPPVADNDPFDFLGNTELRVDVGASLTPHALETTPSTLGVMDGDSDPAEGNAIAVSAITVGACTDATAPFDCTDAAVGTVHMQTNGRFSFEPAAGDFGLSETFQYTITDNGAPPASTTATVTLTRFERVWYIDPTAGAGGTGTSTAPLDSFSSLNGAGGGGDPDVAGDYLFVYAGTLSGTIELEASQHLIGQGVALSIPVNLNANGSPTNLVAAGPKPQLTNPTGDTVRATQAIPVEIVGLSLASTTGNAIDLTSTALLTGAGTLTIDSNELRGAGAEGVDVNLNAGTTGTLVLNVTNNSWNLAGTHNGNAFDARTASAGANLRLNVSNNPNILSTGVGASGIFIDGSGGGSLVITGFANNSVHQNTIGSGILVGSAKFDANPVTVAYEQVSGGTTAIGASGNGVGSAGLSLTSITGDLAFTDLDVFADSGAAVRITGTGAVNTVAGTGTRVTVGTGVALFQASGGPAVDVSSATIDLQPTTISSTGSATTGVALNSVTGTFTAGSASTISNITSGAGTAFQVGSSNATISYAGAINTTTGKGVDLTGNTGSTISFTGALTLSAGSATAFNASGGGTVTTTDTTSTLTTTTGTALNVANTTIGAAGLVFRSISSNGGTNHGIVLNATGSAGGLTVSGTGSAGSGGTIQNKPIGISLTSTRSPSFSWMQLNNFSDFAIRGNTVTNFTLNRSVVNGVNGDNAAANEGSVIFDNLFGSATVSHSTISGGVEDNLRVENTSGTLTSFALSGTGGTGSSCQILNNHSATGNIGFRFAAFNSAVMTASVSNCLFRGNRTDTINIDAANNSTVTSSVTNNYILAGTAGNNQGNLGINVTSGGSGLHTTTVSGNFVGTDGTTPASLLNTGINLFSGNGSTLVATVSGNNVRNAGTGSGHGIQVFQDLTSTLRVNVDSNTVSNVALDFGLRVEGAGDPAAVSPAGSLQAGVTNNNISVLGTALDAIRVRSRRTITLCADIRSNTTNAGGAGFFGLFTAQSNTSTFSVEGLTLGSQSAATTQAYLIGQNPAAATVSSTAVANYNGVAANSCSIP